MSLIAEPDLARGVLETLARFQGRDANPATEEAPGKFLHEMRFGAATGLALGGGDVYYGSVDATPLFVMLLGELRRWGLADEVVTRLLPHADAALGWIEHFGDRDGDGYVEYQRATPAGLANQGWKDSWDAIRFADGRLAEAPIALCEVQGYTYAAYVARAHFAEEAGDHRTQARYLDRARRLKEAFNRDLWLPEHGWYALGLDADKRPIDALASNMGTACGPASSTTTKLRRSPNGCCRPTCSAAGASAPWPRRCGPTTRCPSTTARSGRTTAPCARPA
jgi:glycogen debranching enzyme